jgi:hypothetical protein
MTYGCHNREPLNDLVTVQAGWQSHQGSRTPVLITITDPMTKDCQYTKTPQGQADPGCQRCRHRVDSQRS